jgi:hypothetical protein
MPELSPKTQKLIQLYQNWFQSLQPKEGETTIHVDEVALKVASFYEKIRGVVDWREEHLLRKTAIERILKRRLFLMKDGENIAEPFVYELIRGGHFPNNLIPESKIAEVQRVLDKYIFILKKTSGGLPSRKQQKIQFSIWLLEIAASEIEETLAPPIRERALIEYMFETLREKIIIREAEGMTEEEKNNQIYIAAEQALFRLDPPMIRYHLLRRNFPHWENLSQEELERIAENIYSIKENLEKSLHHPLKDKFYKICKQHSTPYLVLGDIISTDPAGAKEILENPETLEELIKQSYARRMAKLRAKMGRAALYSTLSILITKMLLAFAIELPLDKYLAGGIEPANLAINILGPPFLMFFLVLSIRPPKKENLQRLIMEVMKIVYQQEGKETLLVRSPKKAGLGLRVAVGFFYLLTFVVSFGAIIWLLQELGFSPVSTAIFLMFVSLISFAGVQIREKAKELQVTEEKATFLTFVIDAFSLPYLQFGRWLSSQLEKYNFIMIIFNSLIDMPFQIFTEFLEQWSSFLKEKREEIH